MNHRAQISALRQLYGSSAVPARKDLERSWKAVKAIAAVDGRLGEPEREWLLARMARLGTPPDVVDAVMAWDEEPSGLNARLARAGVSSELPWQAAVWILYEALSVVLAAGDLGASELEAVGAAAAIFDVSPAKLHELADLCRDEAELRRRRIALLASKDGPSFRFDLL